MNTAPLSSHLALPLSRPALTCLSAFGAAVVLLAAPTAHADSSKSEPLRFGLANCEINDLAVARCDSDDPLHPECNTSFELWCRGEGGAVIELFESPSPQQAISCVDGVSGLAPCDAAFTAECLSRTSEALFIDYRAPSTGGRTGECILHPGGLEAGTFCCDNWTPAIGHGTGCSETTSDASCSHWKVDCPGTTALDSEGNLHCS